MSSSIYGGPGYATGQTQRQGATGITKPKHVSGYRHFENMTPEQMELLSQLMGNLGPDSFLSKLAGGDQSAFEEMEAPALKQFSALQGNLASRFSGMGLGGRKSSGFQLAANQQASDFAQQLQSNRLNLRKQALQELMQYGGSLLQQQPYGLVEKQQKSSPWGALAGTGLGAVGGYFAGNPMAGAKLGYNVGSAF